MNLVIHVRHIVRRNLAAGAPAHAALVLHTQDFSGNAAPVWRLANCWEDRADSFDQFRAVFGISKIHGSLNDVVRKGVTEHFLEFTGDQHLIHQSGT